MLFTENRTFERSRTDVAAVLIARHHQKDPQRCAELIERLQNQLPVLQSRLEHLYGHLPDFDSWFTHLLLSVCGYAMARPAPLLQLDKQRALEAGGPTHGLGYCAYVDKFGGNLRGVQARIPYLKALGVTYLHLLPFLKAGHFPNDGGFAVAAFDEVNPELGTMEQLTDLTAALREAGISLCSDLVLNHVSHDHIWAKKARAGDPIFKDYFHWLPSADAVHAREATLTQVFPATAAGNFTYIDEQKSWVWSTFYPYQWDLNFSNPAVFTEIASALLNLANHGVEAFRLDSAGYLWKRDGTNCLNQPEVHYVLQALRCVVEIAAPAVLLKAEAIMPTRDLPPYFGTLEPRVPECHIAYHSSLMAASWVALAESNVSVLAQVLANTPALPDACAWMTYVRCHDDIGWNVLKPELFELGVDASSRLAYVSRFFAGQEAASYAQGASFQATTLGAVHGTNGMSASLVGLYSARNDAQRQYAVQRMMLLYALSLFVGGLPLIYMGDELGQANVGNGELLLRQGTDDRELQRPLFDWSNLAADGLTLTAPNSIYAGLSSLIAHRNTELRAVAKEPVKVVPTANTCVLILSKGGDHFGAFNFSGYAQPLHLPVAILDNSSGLLVDLLSSKDIDTDNVSIAPYGAMWIKRRVG